MYRYRYGIYTAYIRKDDAASEKAALESEKVATQLTINIDSVERKRRAIMAGTALACSMLTATLGWLSAPSEEARWQKVARTGLVMPLAVAFGYGGSASCGL